MRLLVRARRDGRGLEAVERARVAERLALPGFLDDRERLAEAGLALAVGNAEDVVGARGFAAPDPELEASLAEVVHGGDVLGDAERVVQRQDLHRRPDADPLGAGGDRGGHRDRRGEHGAARVEVDLAQPHAVEPQGLGGVHGLEAFAERVGLADSGPQLLDEDAEVHRGARVARGSSVFKARLRASAACYYPVVFHYEAIHYETGR